MNAPAETPPQEIPLTNRSVNEPRITTVQQHILNEQSRFPGASGNFSWLLSGITLAAKMINAEVSRAGLTNLLGAHGDINVQGEVQQKLDVYANEVMGECLSHRETIGILASEENERPVLIHKESPNANYAVIFDPLDGSSNIDVNVSVGTTFSVLHRPHGEDWNDPDKWIMQPGNKQVAAGYVVYGSSTVLVYSVGNGVHGFTLDPSIGAFVLSHENIKMPKQGKYYSCNEANADSFPEVYRTYIDQLRKGELGETYSSRYIGSMVADVHRTLLKGGVFMYPPTESHAEGKLRLLYEANPVAFLVEQAGGKAINGTKRVLDVQPEGVHQRTPLILGSEVEMNALQALLDKQEAVTA